MTAQILGALFLAAAAVSMGIALRAREKRRMRALSEAAEFVRSAMRNIELFSMPVGKLFGGGDPEKMRQTLCAELGRDAAVMADFFDRLGSAHKEDTLRLCTYTLSVLEERLGAAEKDYHARARLYIAMPVLLALSIIVLAL